MTATDGPAGATGRRILVVSPYPPRRDGIGAYAVQQVRALRRAGHHVEVLSPAPSAAHHHGDLRGVPGAALLRRVAAGFDRVVLHLHPDVIYHLPPTPGARVATGMAYGAAFRTCGAEVEIRLHEIDPTWADRSDPTWRATSFLLRGADTITVHSDEQRDRLISGFEVPAERVRLIDHGADFVPRTSADRSRARATLGLPDDVHVFLCIGFVQPHKGFDRAARALGAVPGDGVRLDVVGSVRVDDEGARRHAAELAAIAERDPRVHLHLGYVGDEMFDRWIVACDTVVLPYRHIWSSSVVERAALFDRPVIATRVGGLDHQVRRLPGAILVDDNTALTRAMAEAAGRPSGPAAGAAWPTEGDRARIQAEVEERATAARGGVAPRTWVDGEGRRPPLSAPVRRVGRVATPPPVSARPGVSVVKRLIRRLIAWELDPVVDQVDRLQRATADALDRVEEAEGGSDPDGVDDQA